MTQPPPDPSGGDAALVAAAVTAGAATGVAPSVALAVAARRLQLAVRAAVVRDTIRVWPLLDPKRLDDTWPRWLFAMESLVRHYHGQSAVVAQRSYMASRVLALGTDVEPFVPELPPAPDPQWIRRSLGYAGPGLLREIANPKPQPGLTGNGGDGGLKALATGPDRRIVERKLAERALVVTTGVVSRIVVSGGRDLVTVNGVLRDDRAVGWYRVTAADPCSFCALLASRGAVYKSTTVGTNRRSSRHATDPLKEFVGPGLFKVHDHCMCTVQCIYSRDEELPAKVAEWAQLYRDSTRGVQGKYVMQAFRAAYEGREVPARYLKGADLPLTAGQLTRIQSLLKSGGLADREARLSELGRLVGRRVTSSKGLTKAEAARVLDALKRRAS